MSDGISDLARDKERGEKYGSYLECLLDYLKNPSRENYKEVEEAAEQTDSVRGGYRGGKSSLTEKFNEKVRKLSKGDRRTWAKLLNSLGDDKLYEMFKEISPFKGKLLLKVDYGSRFVNIKSQDIDELLRRRDFRIYDADDYLIALDVSGDEKVDVEWIRCGISGQNCPRNSKGKDKK